MSGQYAVWKLDFEVYNQDCRQWSECRDTPANTLGSDTHRKSTVRRSRGPLWSFLASDAPPTSQLLEEKVGTVPRVRIQPLNLRQDPIACRIFLKTPDF